MPRQLPQNTLLRGETLVGHLGDGTGAKNGERGHEHHHDGHGHRDGQHEDKCPHNGEDAGEELSESLKQAVPHQVHVVHHARDEIAVRVRVDERDGHAADLIARLNAQVAHCLVRQAIDAVSLQPLGDRCPDHHQAEAQDQGSQRGKVHPPGADDEVDALTDEDGHVQLQRHGDRGGHERERERTGMRTHVGKQAPRDLARGHGRDAAIAVVQLGAAARHASGDRRNRPDCRIRIRHQFSPPSSASGRARRVSSSKAGWPARSSTP